MPDERTTLEQLEVRIAEAERCLATCVGLTEHQKSKVQAALAAAFTIATVAKQRREAQA
jgi:hypothetical protein